MGKIHVRFQRFRDFFMLLKFATIIKSDGKTLAFVIVQQSDDGITDHFSFLRRYFLYQVQAATTFRKCHDSARSLFTQYQVSFPVTKRLRSSTCAGLCSMETASGIGGRF